MRNPLPYISWCFQVTNLPNSVLRVGMVSPKPALIGKCPFLAKINFFYIESITLCTDHKLFLLLFFT